MKLVAMMVLELLAGCHVHSAPDAPWSADYDTSWQEVVDCWGVEPAKPVVIVRDDCRSKYDAQDFRVANGWVHGMYSGNTVEVCPDLKALRHEFSHHISLAVRGYAGENGEGVCWL